MLTSPRLRASVLYDYTCLVATTATATATAFVTFVLVVMLMVAPTATAVVSAEELFDFLGSSIVNFLDRSDEVEVFTS